MKKLNLCSITTVRKLLKSREEYLRIPDVDKWELFQYVMSLVSSGMSNLEPATAHKSIHGSGKSQNPPMNYPLKPSDPDKNVTFKQEIIVNPTHPESGTSNPPLGLIPIPPQQSILEASTA